MKTTSKAEILAYIEQNNAVEPKKIIAKFSLSPQIIHRHLKQLLQEKAIIKRGTAPKVWYQSIPKYGRLASTINIDEGVFNCVTENYLSVSPQGDILRGWWGLDQWCQKQNLELGKTATEYCQTLKKYNVYKQHGLINGLPKLKSTFSTINLDELYYLDFYAIERFGKTKLGALSYFAKQNQNRELAKEVAAMTKDTIYRLIRENNISAIGYVPPTIKRSTQLLSELAKLWNWDLPKINIIKNRADKDILVAQKSLSKLSDRVENAQSSIAVLPSAAYDSILLIDDAVGSGATLNETAQKIRAAGLVKRKIIGLALTGSFSGFDVISEI